MSNLGVCHVTAVHPKMPPAPLLFLQLARPCIATQHAADACDCIDASIWDQASMRTACIVYSTSRRLQQDQRALTTLHSCHTSGMAKPNCPAGAERR